MQKNTNVASSVKSSWHIY